MNGCASIANDKIHVLTILDHQGTSDVELECHLAPIGSATKKNVCSVYQKKTCLYAAVSHLSVLVAVWELEPNFQWGASSLSWLD